MIASRFLSTYGLASIGWGIILMAGTISLLLGLLAALVGGRLTALGNGMAWRKRTSRINPLSVSCPSCRSNSRLNRTGCLHIRSCHGNYT
jgi:hypothetical protein